MQKLNNFKNWLMEQSVKLLQESFIINHNVRYGQVMFLVGGPGSGKDFITEKVTIANYKQYKKFSSDTIVEFLPKYDKFEKLLNDTHELLKQVIEHSPLADKRQEKEIVEWMNESIPYVFKTTHDLMNYFDYECPNEIKLRLKEKEILKKKYYPILSLSNKNVAVLRLIMFIFNLDTYYIKNFIEASKEKQPNNLQNIALEFIGNEYSFKSKSMMVQDCGYDKENISVVWVLTKVYKAQENNISRPRSINPTVLSKMHVAAATGIGDFLKDYQKYMNGEIWIIFNSKEFKKFEYDKSNPLSAKEQYKEWNNKLKTYNINELDDNITYVKIKSKNKPLFVELNKQVKIDEFKEKVNEFSNSSIF